MRTPAWSARRLTPSRWLVAGALGMVIVVAAACSSGSSTSTTSTTAAAGTSGPAAVTVASVGSVGSVLVNAQGMTLYHNTQDTATKLACTGACTSIWPPLTVPAGTTHVVGGTGVTTADLGTVMLSDGSHQVTYKGMPLYTYTGDAKAGDASGQGVGGIWFVLSRSAAPSASGTSSPPTTAKSSGGYGY